MPDRSANRPAVSLDRGATPYELVFCLSAIEGNAALDGTSDPSLRGHGVREPVEALTQNGGEDNGGADVRQSGVWDPAPLSGHIEDERVSEEFPPLSASMTRSPRRSRRGVTNIQARVTPPRADRPGQWEQASDASEAGDGASPPLSENSDDYFSAVANEGHAGGQVQNQQSDSAVEPTVIRLEEMLQTDPGRAAETRAHAREPEVERAPEGRRRVESDDVLPTWSEVGSPMEIGTPMEVGTPISYADVSVTNLRNPPGLSNGSLEYPVWRLEVQVDSDAVAAPVGQVVENDSPTGSASPEDQLHEQVEQWRQEIARAELDGLRRGTGVLDGLVRMYQRGPIGPEQTRRGSGNAPQASESGMFSGMGRTLDGALYVPARRNRAPEPMVVAPNEPAEDAADRDQGPTARESQRTRRGSVGESSSGRQTLSNRVGGEYHRMGTGEFDIEPRERLKWRLSEHDVGRNSLTQKLLKRPEDIHPAELIPLYDEHEAMRLAECERRVRTEELRGTFLWPREVRQADKWLRQLRLAGTCSEER